MQPKSIELCATNWLIFSLNFAQGDAASWLMAPSGGRPVATWESATKNAVIIFRSRSANVLGGIYTNVHIASVIFLGCAGSNEQSRAWPVAARTMEASSTRGFD